MKINRNNIQDSSDLSYAITTKALFELKYKQLVSSSSEGRSTVYWLSEDGIRLVKILSERVG